MTSVAAATPAVSAAIAAISGTPVTVPDITVSATAAPIGALAAGSPDHNENSHHRDDDGDTDHIFHWHPRRSPAPAAYELKDMRA